jgi:F-type H+-transporting ATPase subunit delta
MIDRRVGRRYAQALFTTALKLDVVASVEDDLNGIVHLLENDGEFRHFMLAPYAGREQKTKFAERVFADRVTALTMQMLRVVLEKQRENELPVIRDEYVVLRRQNDSILYAKVTSAEALDEGQKNAVVSRLETILSKKVEASFHIDPATLGGVRVEYENTVLDGTARGALSRLRERLRYDLLKQS